MRNRDLKKQCVSFFLCFFLGSAGISNAATPTAYIVNARISNAKITGMNLVIDPCTVGTPAIGTVCTGGALYAGTYNGLSYMVTPGKCSDSAEPDCPGGTDNLGKAWSSADVVTGVTNADTGEANTAALVALGAAYAAANFCYNMQYSGHDDWFLGARNENINVLYNNRAALGDFKVTEYWSSTESNNVNAWSKRFDNNGYNITESKDYADNVRCIRTFVP